MQNNLILYIRGTSDIPVVRTAASNITSLRICKHESLAACNPKKNENITVLYLQRKNTRVRFYQD